MTPQDAYVELVRRFHRMAVLGRASAILGWDRSTFMPAGATEDRAEQLATLGVMGHELLVAPDMGDLLASAEEGADRFEDWPRANLREMRRHWSHARALDAALVERRTRATAACEMVWRQAKADGDFAALLPTFREVLAVTRQVADAKVAALSLAPYDALLDEYEPGSTAARVSALFEPLRSALPGLLQRVLEVQRRAGAPLPLPGPFPVEAQRALGERFMRALGFDFERGRLDVSAHPFTGGTPDDVRITTRYDEADFSRALMGVLHETGHALYELGLPAAWRHQPVGAARGMALHESQSLLIEMQACRSRDFAIYSAPHLATAFGGSGPAWTADNLYRHQTRVAPGFIRIDADELTYPLHVVLRFELERALLSGDLALADLPGAWNDGMRDLLGIVPPTDREGCLQDIHWPDGAFGYFPTYTMGALAAAQLFAAALAAEPGIPTAIAAGDFAPLVGWLRTHVHGRGSSASTDAILERATGAPLGTATFLRHLETRYLAAYE